MNTIHAGHAPAGKANCGAVGILNESIVNRDILREFMRIHDAEYEPCFIDITCDNITYSLGGLCKRADEKAGREDFNISLHINASTSKDANGCEVLCYSNANKEFSDYLSNKLSEKLGVKNRGAKIRPELKFLNSTIGRSIIVESFFCTNENDCNTYNNGGNEKIARAILETMEHFGLASKKHVGGDNVQEMGKYLYTVQVGAFGTKESAENYKNKLNDLYGVTGFVKEK